MRAPGAIGGLPRAFWVLWSGTVIIRLGTMVEPFLAFYLTRTRHMSLGSTGGILTLWFAGSLVSQPVAGVLADRIGRRATLAGGMLISAAAMIALAYARGLGAMLPAVLTPSPRRSSGCWSGTRSASRGSPRTPLPRRGRSRRSSPRACWR